MASFVERLRDPNAVIGMSERQVLAVQIEELEAELERERMRHAACGVVALANTRESAEHARQMHPEYRSASVQAVESAVDREMLYREQVKTDEALMRQALEFFEKMDNSGLPMRSHERTTIAALRERLMEKK